MLMTDVHTAHLDALKNLLVLAAAHGYSYRYDKHVHFDA
jgi:hypothetical protein